VRAPPIQRFLALCQKFVALIDGCDTGNRPFLMVEDLVGNMGRHSKPRHAGNYGSSEVVQPPSNDAREFVKRAL